MLRIAAFYALTTAPAVGLILAVVAVVDRPHLALDTWIGVTFGLTFWAGSTLFQWTRIGRKRP